MSTEKDISSTEMLLKVIRRREGGGVNPGGLSSKGFMERAKERWLASGSKKCLGVEISGSVLNLVKTRWTGMGWEVLHAGSERMPGGMNLDHPDFPGFLKERLQELGKDGRVDAWVCLSPSKGEVWNTRIPKLKKGLSNAVYWSARKEKTFEREEYLFDYGIKGEAVEDGARKLLAEVAVASAWDVEQWRRLFARLGYPLKGVTLPAFALDNLFAGGWAESGEGAYAVLHIGEDTSFVEINDRQGILFSRVIRTGRDAVLDAQAEAGQGGGGEDPPRDKLLEAISPALERIARQVERTIDHSVNILGNPAPEALYFSGGPASLPGVSGFFSEQLGLRVETLDILDPVSGRVSGDASVPGPGDRHSPVVSAGAAMPSKRTINFLHTALDRDRERAALRNTSAVAGTCALMFVLVAGCWWSAERRLEQARARVAALEERLEEYSPRTTKEMILDLAGEIRRDRETLREYARRLRPVAVLKEISRTTPDGLSLRSLTLDNVDSGDGTLVLEGFIRGDNARFDSRLTAYLLGLRRSPLFRDCSVRDSGLESLSSGEQVLRFTLDVEMEEVQDDPVA